MISRRELTLQAIPPYTNFTRCVLCSTYYLVFNASILYWQLLRPFMKTGYLRCLAPSLQLICKQLEDVQEPDVEWRAQLILYSISSYFY